MMEAATYGECPVCRAHEGEFCNPDQGAYGTHYGRVRMAQENARRAIPQSPQVTTGERQDG